MKQVGTAFVVFGTFEIRQYFIKRPARIAQGSPMIVVAMMATRIDHGVDGTRSAQHLAARLIAASAIETWLRHGVESPVGLPGLCQQRESCRAVNQHATVGGAGFKQSYVDGGIFAQSCGEHATGRAAANNDVVRHTGIVRQLVACLRFALPGSATRRIWTRNFRPTRRACWLPGMEWRPRESVYTCRSAAVPRQCDA